MKRWIKSVVLFSLVLCFTGMAGARGVTNHQAADYKTSYLFQTAIQRFVQNRYPDSRITVELLFLPKELPALGSTVVKVSCRKRGKLIGRTLFTLTFKDRDGIWQALQVWAAVRRYQRVLILTRDIPGGHVITREDVVSEIREVIWPRSQSPATLQQSLGRRSKRRLAKGRIVMTSMLEKIPLVDRGKRVKMHIVNKNLSITMPAIAYGKGGPGDIIRVKNPDTGQFYRVEIVDSENVLLKK